MPLRPTERSCSAGMPSTCAGVGNWPPKSSVKRRAIVAAAFDESCCDMMEWTSALYGSVCCESARPHAPYRRIRSRITGSRRISRRRALA
jgi:hypothetical protein